MILQSVWICVCLAVLMASSSASAQCVLRSVVVGADSVRGEGGKIQLFEGARQDAEAFAAWLRQRARCGGASQARSKSEDPEVLKEKATRRQSILETLSSVLGKATADDEVVLFFSMHGYRNGKLLDSPGFLIGFDGMLATGGASTGINLEQLRDQIQNSLAKRIFVFADITRIGEGENDVASALKKQLELVGLRRVNGVVGSQPKKLSLVVGGGGLFTRILTNKLKTIGPSGERIETLVREIQKEILIESQKMNKQQQPEQLGDGQALIARGPQERILVASMAPVAAPDGSAQEESSWSEPVDSESLRLESEGQEALLRYGEGIHLPGDPRKPTANSFYDASEKFRLALEKRKRRFRNPKLEEADKRTIEAKQRLTRGLALAYDKLYKEAESELIRAAALDSFFPETQNALGIVYLENGRIDEAISSFDKSIELAPDWSYPRLNRALALMSSGDNDKALAAYRDALKRLPDSPFLHFNLGGLLQILNQTPEALKSYRQAQTLFDSQAKQLQAGLNDHPEYTERLSSIRLNEAEVHNSIGVLWRSRGSNRKAQKSFDKALELDPTSGPANLNSGALLLEQGAYQEALKRFDLASNQEVLRSRAQAFAACAQSALQATRQQARYTKACIARIGR